MAGFGMVLNGLQALFELFMIMKFGVNILNVLQLILAISSLMATMRYLETLSGTNTCTTEEECPANSGNGFISQGQVDYLAYYDLKVISNDTVSQKQNIQKILALLNQDPTFLESNYGTRKKYIYVGDTNDVYINDDSVIIAISQKQLFSGTSISALINQSTASLQ